MSLKRTTFAAVAFAAMVAASTAASAMDEQRHPRLHQAAQQLDAAIDTLNPSGVDDGQEYKFSGHRARAVELARQARAELEEAARSIDSAEQPVEPVATYGDAPVYDDPPSDWIPPPEPVIYVQAPPPSNPVGFWGHHPIPGGGWCLAEGAHVHYYEPEFFDQFQLVNGFFRFGEGFREWFYAGQHPIPGGGWCGIYEPHRHPYRPEVGFIYDPRRHGYYYDREHAVVIRTEVVRPPPHYEPPREVVGHVNHPPELHPAPVGTIRPQPWQHERVIVLPPPRPIGQPPVRHDEPGHGENHPPMPPGRPVQPIEQHPAPPVAHPAPPPEMHTPFPIQHPAEPPPTMHVAPQPPPTAHPAPPPAAHPTPLGPPQKPSPGVMPKRQADKKDDKKEEKK